jgi:hypothetical protein
MLRISAIRFHVDGSGAIYLLFVPCEGTLTLI